MGVAAFLAVCDLKATRKILHHMRTHLSVLDMDFILIQAKPFTLVNTSLLNIPDFLFSFNMCQHLMGSSLAHVSHTKFYSNPLGFV